MTSRLTLYNGALLLCGERALSALTENVEPRYLLDTAWNDGAAAQYCLEQGQWHFAMRSSRMDYNPSITPEWGYPRAFDKPTDWVATSGVFSDEFMKWPLTDYADEVSYWFANVDEIFVKYVSNSTTYGMDLSRWPASFADYVHAYLASKIVRKLPGGADKVEDICRPKAGVLDRALLIAKNKAAMANVVTFPTRGTWVAARHGNRGLTGRDGGSLTNLIG